jgi:hypothetical protein
MSASRLRRPPDENYFIKPWSDTFLQGDIFDHVPFAMAAPPDAVFTDEGDRRFVSGPFDSTLAMLISPSCVIAAQGDVPPGTYAHPARTMVPIRPLKEMVTSGSVPERNVELCRKDRLRSLLYVPAGISWPESVALLHMPITMHHNVIIEERLAQLTGEAFWHLRVKLMAYTGGFLLDPSELGDPPASTERTS